MSVPTREVVCPNCNAQPDEVCTRATSTGRAVVTTFHTARITLALDTEAPKVQPSPREVVAEAILTPLQNDPTVTLLACDCGSDLDITQETTVADVLRLLDHAAHAHTGRRDIVVHRASVLASGHELGAMLRLDPLTEAERKWRADRA